MLVGWASFQRKQTSKVYERPTQQRQRGGTVSKDASAYNASFLTIHGSTIMCIHPDASMRFSASSFLLLCQMRQYHAQFRALYAGKNMADRISCDGITYIFLIPPPFRGTYIFFPHYILDSFSFKITPST